MKISLLGPQGSGKGTIGKIISEKLGIPIIGVGDILRDVPKDHPRYEELNEIMDRGDLAPQDFVAELLKERVSQKDCEEGFIMDGWGRKLIDFEYYDPEFDKVVVLDISRETSVKRITGRRMCTSNGKTYNIYTLPKEMLEECEGELIQREDDTEKAVNKRLDIYYSETVKSIDKFKKKGILVVVDGEGTPEEVVNNVLSAINLPHD